MVIRLIETALLLALSLLSDFRGGRIDNRIILFFIPAGVLTGLAASGPGALPASLLGILLPPMLLFWLYLPGMLGAGDIKLFCAVGAIAGAGFVLPCIAWSFLAGGVAALAVMLVRRNAVARFRYLGSYLKACFLTGSFLEYAKIKDNSDGSKFHFSAAIAAGAMIQAALTLL